MVTKRSVPGGLQHSLFSPCLGLALACSAPAAAESLPIPNYPIMEAGHYLPGPPCPAIRTADGRLVLLSAPLPDRAAGTPVMVLADRSARRDGPCAGMTIEVLDHKRLNRLPDPAGTSPRAGQPALQVLP